MSEINKNLPNKSVYKLVGKLQDYKWGGNVFIPSLLGQKVTDEPVAEYWLGAHPNASSTLKVNENKLVDFINTDPKTILGARVYKRFHRLPYLFKVLDVKNMLSIQVHPSKPQAEEGFAREEALGIPRDAAHRNYKDDNHKPEIMVALSDFWLLHGFKSSEKIKEILLGYPELHHLMSVFEKDGYEGLYCAVMLEDDEATLKTLKPLLEELESDFDAGKLSKNQPEYWAVKAFRSFCSPDKIDKGIYSIFFLNLVHLKKGQAIFQDAGVPHAYLQGQNIELMANSDNVLRAGLTSKHMDIPELLSQVKFCETIPNVFEGDILNDNHETVYQTPVEDFQLSKIELEKNERFAVKSSSLEIHFVLEGAIQVNADDYLNLSKGEAFFTIAGCSYEILAQENSLIFKASCPL
ncbi:mannose-6-phosphate isomerase, class I [Nonlabens spongiae]|uniref:mannose-6-phosphate isomerase n=1 Tax=Nonlabens spongiae TaxID=331648 RepID=A0A1W6MJ62_9FLAO|nr:mannose-6-phosphate isomerase, class I [Nonlabens spongiae]ARN77623.1 mannose-6-phosphate isomerase, class I [Nonlabens spongiae]